MHLSTYKQSPLLWIFILKGLIHSSRISLLYLV